MSAVGPETVEGWVEEDGVDDERCGCERVCHCGMVGMRDGVFGLVERVVVCPERFVGGFYLEYFEQIWQDLDC